MYTAKPIKVSWLTRTKWHSQQITGTRPPHSPLPRHLARPPPLPSPGTFVARDPTQRQHSKAARGTPGFTVYQIRSIVLEQTERSRSENASYVAAFATLTESCVPLW